MERPTRIARRTSVALLGVVFLAFTGWYIAATGRNSRTVLTMAVPLVVGVALVVVQFDLYRREVSDAVVWRAASMGVVGAVVVGAISLWRIEVIAGGNALAGRSYSLISEYAAIGAVTGTELGYHYATSRRRTDQLAAQNQRLNDFASIVSHDLRNPLNVAMGYVQLAREEDDTSYLPEADQALKRMNGLIDEVLAFARQEEDFDSTESVTIGSIARAAVTTAPIDESAVVVDADVTVMADPDRLRTLFENLFRNAIEHGTDDENVVVQVGVLDDGSGFYVQDDGPGIPAEQRERVFEAGYSADGGTGLGLAIVRQIAEAHDWRIEIWDSPLGGAQFVFLFE